MRRIHAGTGYNRGGRYDNSNADQQAAFGDGRVCFQEQIFHEITTLRDMESDFGIVPLPKFDETVDRYYCNVNAACNGIMVPATISDPEFVSAVLEAICYENNRLVIPAYYEKVLQGKAVRDDDSIEMLDIISASRNYDTGYFMLGINSADHNFASHYAQNSSAALNLIKQVNETYK